MSELNFYKNLQAVSGFSELMNIQSYKPLPLSWCLVVSDIVDSTGHIAGGEFKEVNMVSASVIAAVSNHVKNIELPFTFSGDGTLIAIPGKFSDEVTAIVESCISMASENFNLKLAAGLVPVKELYDAGYDLRVAKEKTSMYVTQAAFMGEGVFRAEELVKERAVSVTNKKTEIDLTGLECRWNSFPARKEAVSLIVRAIGNNTQVQSNTYQQVLSAVSDLYGDEVDLKPVRQQDMKLAFSPRLLMAEIKIRSKADFFNRLIYASKLFYRQIIGHLLMKFNITTKNNRWGVYKPEFIKNSDYRKFSGDLKMIITGTTNQKEKLNQYLENLYQQNRIIYGMHISKATITTCFVTEYQSNHIHFVDGSDGGYTRAAVDFKKRLLNKGS